MGSTAYALRLSYQGRHVVEIFSEDTPTLQLGVRIQILDQETADSYDEARDILLQRLHDKNIVIDEVQ